MEEKKQPDLSILSLPKHKNKFALKPAHVIVLGFLALILLGSAFLSMPFSSKSGTFSNYLNMLFTATSAVCVTGLVVVDTASHFSIVGQVALLLLIQVGGLGFMSLTTMFMMLLRKKITLKDRLVIQEALNQNNNKGIIRLTRNLVIVTLIIEGVGMAMLLPVFIASNGAIGVWQAAFTSISAFCNAGFDILGATSGMFSSLMGYTTNILVNLSVCMLIVLGGIGFAVIMDIIKNRFRFKKLMLHSKVVLLISGILIVLGFLLFLIMEFNNPDTMGDLNFGQKLMAALFHSVSTRTAGFNTINLTGLSPASKLVTMIFMFIGASPGSTGGGIKTTTLAILILLVVSGIKNDDSIIIGKRTLSHRTGFKAVSVVMLALTLVVSATLILLVTEKNHIPPNLLSLDNIMFECFSAFGTVGLSLGITPYLSPFGQLIIMLLMFFGRVGPVTIGLLFIKRKHELIKYPEGNLMIG